MRTLPWFFLVFVLALALELLHDSQFHILSTVDDLHALSLPSRVEFVSRVQNVHFSGPARVFDAEAFSLTCYERHPSALRVLFSGDVVRIWARLESTPRGLLCVVESVTPDVGA